jgi:hypothetical protein
MIFMSLQQRVQVPQLRAALIELDMAARIESAERARPLVARIDRTSGLRRRHRGRNAPSSINRAIGSRRHASRARQTNAMKALSPAGEAPAQSSAGVP